MADHIIQKKNESTWYVRLDIPKDVRRALGNRTVLIQSLKTGMRSEAMVRRLPILAQWKADIAAARHEKIAVREQWRPELANTGLRFEQHLVASVLDAVTNPYKATSGTPATEILARVGKVDQEIQEFLREVQRLEDTGVPGLVERVRASLANVQHIPLADAQMHAVQLARDVAVQLAENKYNLSPQESEEARELIIKPTLYKPRSPISKSMIEAWSKHLVTQIRTVKTRDVHKARIERISKYLTTEGAPLNFDTIHDFLTKQGGARQTLTNYLWSGRDFWKWANKYSGPFREQFVGQPCPFDGHDLPRVGKDAGESYTPFTRKEVEQLYKTAKSGGKDNLANLIVFGAYTGARLEEIGRTKA